MSLNDCVLSLLVLYYYFGYWEFICEIVMRGGGLM